MPSAIEVNQGQVVLLLFQELRNSRIVKKLREILTSGKIISWHFQFEAET